MRVVIADDDRDSADSLGELLRVLVAPPVQVLIVFDGQEALLAVQGCTPLPDAVILDVEMPRMNGVDAALAIRSALGNAAPLLIAVTGHAGMFQMACFGQAFDHVLMKPLQVEVLLGLLHRPERPGLT